MPFLQASHLLSILAIRAFSVALRILNEISMKEWYAIGFLISPSFCN